MLFRSKLMEKKDIGLGVINAVIIFLVNYVLTVIYSLHEIGFVLVGVLILAAEFVLLRKMKITRIFYITSLIVYVLLLVAWVSSWPPPIIG